MGQSIETDPDVITRRYREPAEQYRQLADASAKREAFLRLAAIYDSLAEGMINIREVREGKTTVPEKPH